VVLAELLDEGRLMGSADARCLPPVPLIKISTFLFASARAAASTTSPDKHILLSNATLVGMVLQFTLQPTKNRNHLERNFVPKKTLDIAKNRERQGLPDHIRNFDGETQGYLNVNKLRRGTKIRKS